MRNSTFLRRQAEACIALSRATFDLTAASRLRAMAAELRARARVSLSWHDGLSNHPAYAWMREEIVAVCRAL